MALMMLSAGRASATPPPPQPQATDLARMGDEARVAGRFTEAEASYRAALQLVPDDRTELSLGLALAAQGKAREAAPILARLLRKAVRATQGTAPRATADTAPGEAASRGGLSEEERERAARALADARRELATVTVDADVAGAVIEVDGARVGSSPLPEALFLGPGRHTVRATHEGYRTSQAIFDAEANRTYAVRLALPREAAPADGASTQDDRPRSEARDVRQSLPRDVPQSVPRDVPQSPPPEASPFPAGSYLTGPGGAVRAAGITLTAAGLLAGISALVAAEVKSGQLAAQSARLGSDPARCWEPSDEVATACARLDAGIAARNRTASAASVLFAGSGVAAATTLLSVFLLPPTRPVGAKVGGLDFTLSPHAGPQGGGVSLEASW